jgi:hypothetical protein
MAQSRCLQDIPGSNLAEGKENETEVGTCLLGSGQFLGLSSVGSARVGRDVAPIPSSIRFIPGDRRTRTTRMFGRLLKVGVRDRRECE